MTPPPPPVIVGSLSLISVPTWEPNAPDSVPPPAGFTALRHFNYQTHSSSWFRRWPNSSSRFFNQAGASLVNHEGFPVNLDRWSSVIHARHAADPLLVLYGATVFQFPNASSGLASASDLTPLADFLSSHAAHLLLDIYPRPSYKAADFVAWADARLTNALTLQNLCGRRVYIAVTPQDQFKDPSYVHGTLYEDDRIAWQTDALARFPSLGAFIFGGIASPSSRTALDRALPSFASTLLTRRPSTGALP